MKVSQNEDRIIFFQIAKVILTFNWFRCEKQRLSCCLGLLEMSPTPIKPLFLTLDPISSMGSTRLLKWVQGKFPKIMLGKCCVGKSEIWKTTIRGNSERNEAHAEFLRSVWSNLENLEYGINIFKKWTGASVFFNSKRAKHPCHLAWKVNGGLAINGCKDSRQHLLISMQFHLELLRRQATTTLLF